MYRMPWSLINSARRVHHQNISGMNKSEFRHAGSIRLLEETEMKNIKGGSIVNYLMKFAAWGAGYFFNMGVSEGRKMRALL